jgi:hypothetical protein
MNGGGKKGNIVTSADRKDILRRSLQGRSRKHIAKIVADIENLENGN